MRIGLLGVVACLVMACGIEEGIGHYQGLLEYDENGNLDPSSIPSTGPVPEECVRIEGGDIGSPDLTVESLALTTQVASWTAKEGEGEFVGFTLHNTMGFAVKAGGETHYDVAEAWMHPEGDSGAEASGISNVTFCPPTEPGGDGSDDPGSDDPGPSNPPTDDPPTDPVIVE